MSGIKKKAVKTAKTQKVIMIPEVRNYIVQPNRITNAIYNYTLLQERIFTAIIFHLQKPIEASMNNNDFRQLDLFTGSDRVRFHIPLKGIAHARQYSEVKDAIKSMASIVVEIPYIDVKEKKRTRITSLFSADIPEESDYSSYIAIDMEKVVAEKLIDIDKDHNQRPINYTRYIYEIAQSAKNKYTSRLYKIISSWKKKGGFIISLATLKEQLGVIDKYPSYSDFKRRVLIPAYTELYEKADCWFNCKAKDFEMRDGKEVTHLSFKVITPDFQRDESKKTEYIRNILKDHYTFLDEDFNSINHILQNEEINSQDILRKIMNVSEKLIEDTSIVHTKAYLIKALINEFGSNPN